MKKGNLVHESKTPQYRTIRCKATKGLTKWCFGVCQPVHGRGFCGRVAPHGLKGRTQLAIEKYNAARREAGEDEAKSNA